MRQLVIFLGGAIVLTMMGPTPGLADLGSDRGTGGPGGSIVGGRPTAIVVATPAGDSTVYEGRGGSGARWVCRYYGLTDSGGFGGGGVGIWVDERGGPITPSAGQAVGFQCVDQAGRVVRSEIMVYDPGDPVGGLFAAERAAALAMSQLELPAPAVAMSPPGDQLVGIATWMWIEGGWAPLSASATIAAVTATVTATPTAVRWDLGDGTSVTCAGTGVAYSPSVASGDACTATFTDSSADLPGGTRRLTATVTYRVGWAASTGEGDDLGELTAIGGLDVRVVEVQAVIN